jgi:pSer/pThr/pTyr-binding forkhead associated (FHA) protein
MHVRLVIVGGKANKSRVSVELPTVIGRSREANLTVAHPMISRKHCELFEVDGLVMVRDLGSLNGLFVAGTQVSEAALHPNAEFTVGPLSFRVEYEYMRRTAASPDATTIDENGPLAQPPGAPDAESPEPGPEVEIDAPFVPPRSEQIGVGGQPAQPGDEPTPSEAGPAIAPPDGQLPDFSAWDVDETEEAEDEQLGQTLPTPPEFFGAPPGPEASLPETGQAGAPDSAPPAPGPSMAETAASDPKQVANQGHQAPAETAPPGSTPRSVGPEPAEAEPPADSKPPTSAEGSTGNSTSGSSTSGGSTSDGQTDAATPQGEGHFDLSLPPPPEVDQSDDAEPPDHAQPPDELDKFLRGLE